MPEMVEPRDKDDEGSHMKKRKLFHDRTGKDPRETTVVPSATGTVSHVEVKSKPLDLSALSDPLSPAPKSQARSSVGPNHSTAVSRYNGQNGKVHKTPKEKARSLLPIRQKLPIWPRAEAIRQGLRTKDILLLVGETGSGKSTQVPQFLVTEPWCQRRAVRVKPDPESGTSKQVSVGGCIAITEPRRVAAITLARRVADEMGTPLGSASPASTVGYSVRFDNSTSPSTRVKFLTEGMLLQEMLRDPWLRQYSAVVVDEVHERGVNVDLLMGFLRRMVAGRNEGRGGVPLKVVVMSATADMLALLNFFDDGFRNTDEHKGDEPLIHDRDDLLQNDEEAEWFGFSDSSDDGSHDHLPSENGKSVDAARKAYSVQASHTNGDVSGMRASNSSPRVPPGPFAEAKDSQLSSKHVSVCHVEGRQYPVRIIYATRPVPDIIDASLKIVFEINYKEPLPGDILVFLPGQSTVESLCALITSQAEYLDKGLPSLLPLPLFAALPQHAQKLVFDPPPPRTRKVIVATNIAETSLTVPGVRHVLDSGKSKLKQFRPRLGLDSLLVKPISKSSAVQRTGRAGREGPGTCHRLYTAADFATLAPVPEPEILRADLAQAVLALKAQGVPTNDLPSFPFLSPPPREALEAALLHLHRLGALSDEGEITLHIGAKIAPLPVSAALGRALLVAATPEMDCLEEMVDLAACLSGEAIFLAVEDEEGREKAEAARRSLLRREGDHLTMVAALRGFMEEGIDRKAWAEKHFVSHRAMRGVLDIRKQLKALAASLPASSSKHLKPSAAALDNSANNTDSTTSPSIRLQPVSEISSSSSAEKSSSLLRCLLYGFPLNAALLCPDGSYRTLAGRQAVAIHPSSVLYGRIGTSRPAAIVYSEFVYTTRAYARGVSAVEREWILEALGA